MFNTTNLMKFGASAIAALLVFLLVNWGASALYQVAAVSHGEEGEDGHGAVQGYVIAADDHAEAETEEPEAEVTFADVYAAADADKGSKVFGKCKACHKLDEGAHATGPSLFGVVDAPIAGADGFGYSDAMTALAGSTWTPEELDAWLAKPKDYAPGNKMTFAGLKKIEDRANLIAYLATIGG